MSIRKKTHFKLEFKVSYENLVVEEKLGDLFIGENENQNNTVSMPVFEENRKENHEQKVKVLDFQAHHHRIFEGSWQNLLTVLLKFRQSPGREMKIKNAS